MEFLSDIFIKYWKEVVVAVMLTATLPFIRKYVRKQRANMLKFFREKEQLKQSLLDEEKKRKEAEELLVQERKAREKSERKLQAETDAKPLYEQGEKYYADENYNMLCIIIAGLLNWDILTHNTIWGLCTTTARA